VRFRRRAVDLAVGRFASVRTDCGIKGGHIGILDFRCPPVRRAVLVLARRFEPMRPALKRSLPCEPLYEKVQVEVL